MGGIGILEQRSFDKLAPRRFFDDDIIMHEANRGACLFEQIDGHNTFPLIIIGPLHTKKMLFRGLTSSEKTLLRKEANTRGLPVVFILNCKLRQRSSSSHWILVCIDSDQVFFRNQVLVIDSLCCGSQTAKRSSQTHDGYVVELNQGTTLPLKDVAKQLYAMVARARLPADPAQELVDAVTNQLLYITPAQWYVETAGQNFAYDCGDATISNLLTLMGADELKKDEEGRSWVFDDVNETMLLLNPLRSTPYRQYLRSAFRENERDDDTVYFSHPYRCGDENDPVYQKLVANDD